MGIRSSIFVLFLGGHSLLASFETMPCSARFAALAGAGVAWRSGADCIYLNPATLYGRDGFDLHLFFTKPYGLEDLYLENVAARYESKYLTGGIGIVYYGNQYYHESQFLVAAALPISQLLSIGFTGRYGRIDIKDYGHAGSFMMDIGLVVQLDEKMLLGFAGQNMSNTKIGEAREPVPSTMTMGAHVMPLPNCTLDFDLYKDIRFPLDVRCGISCLPLSLLTVSLAVGSQPSRFCAGFSVTCFRICVEYAFSSHLELGLTHLFSIGVF